MKLTQAMVLLCVCNNAQVPKELCKNSVFASFDILLTKEYIKIDDSNVTGYSETGKGMRRAIKLMNAMNDL